MKGENCHGGERSKQRLTVVLTCNSDGSEKLRPWIIGKSKNPRCFKNIDLSLPCDYTHQKNAWIDTVAFRKWLIKFNQTMVVKRRQVLLTMDNCKAHDVSNLKLQNVRIQFLPPNTTSRVQPLDQGIIALLKRNYRKKLVRAAIAAAESNQEMKKWTVLDALRSIGSAWNSISPQQIKNCFIKALTPSDSCNLNMEVIVEECEEWDYLSSINRNITTVK